MSPALAKLLMCVCAGGTGAAVIPAAKAVQHRIAPRHSPVHKVAAVATPCEPIYTAGPSIGGPDLGFVGPGGDAGLGSALPISAGVDSDSSGIFRGFGSGAGYAPGGGGGRGFGFGGGGGGGQPGAPGMPVTGGNPLTGSGGGNPNTPTVSNAPEPAAWAMMISGFGLLGGAMRYSRRQGSAAA